MFELVICNHDGKPLKRFDLAAAETKHQRVIIGRADDCDIQINVGSISRHHAAIEPDEDDWIIRDLGSTHGVKIDDQRVPQATIRDGLQVVIGPAVLKFVATVPTPAIAAQIAKELGA
jgi:pSer/pThr/pTyr-binding forkhead associated (FHA) protein